MLQETLLQTEVEIIDANVISEDKIKRINNDKLRKIIETVKAQKDTPISHQNHNSGGGHSRS